MSIRKKSPNCSFSGCKNKSNCKDIHLYRFPKEEKRCKAWVKASHNDKLIGIPAAKLYAGAYLCNDHFEDWCFMNKDTKHRLVHNAIPGCSKLNVSKKEILNLNLNASISNDVDRDQHSSILEKLLETPVSAEASNTNSEVACALVHVNSSPVSNTPHVNSIPRVNNSPVMSPFNLGCSSSHVDELHSSPAPIIPNVCSTPTSHDSRRKYTPRKVKLGLDFSDDNVSQNEIDEIKKRKVQNKIRCQQYTDKNKEQTYDSSQIYKHRTITVEEEEKYKRHKEYNKQKSQRHRDKKRATNLINLRTNQSLKTAVRHDVVSKCQNFHNSQIAGPSARNVPYVPPIHTAECQNFHNSQIAGPSTRNVPYVPPIHTADLSTRSETYIPESNSKYDIDIHNDTPLQANYVPQLHEPIINYVPNTQNILPCDVQNNTQNMHSQPNLPVQTYSSFQENFSAHLEFQKDFFENDFGNACDICDRLWFKKDLKTFHNNDTSPNIQFIRTMLRNVNVVELKV